MKKLSKLTALLSAAALMASLPACGGTGGGQQSSTGDADATPAPATPAVSTPAAGDPGAPADAKYSIGIIQLMKHVALDEARDGFIAALSDKGIVDGQNATIDYKDGNGDNNTLSTIASQFVSDKKDVVLAIATPAAQAIAAKTTEIPILATAVTSFTEAGLVDSDEAPGGNISGTNDMNPIAEQLDLMFKLCPDVKTVGFLYNSSEDNSRLQVDIAKGILDEKGIKYVERTVSNQNEVQQATQSIVTECDVIYLPTDNVFASTMPVVQEITVAAGVPTVCGENGMVSNGGFASLGLTYYDLGYQAGLMAYEILVNGADISTMPVKGAANFEYMINGDTAKGLGIEIPADLQEYVITPEA